MRVLITGSNGLLGQKLLRTLSETQELIGVDLAEKPFVTDVPHPYYRLDITDRRAVTAFVREQQPHAIVHTAAMTGVDQCEINKEACWKVNVSGTDYLLNAAARVGARFVFISSDYVFDGKNGPYKEDDPPNPIGYYGRSKHAAENLVRGSGLEWTIVRTIVLYGVGIKVNASFVTWLLDRLRQGREVNIVNDQWGNTTIVDDLATGIERIILMSGQGLFHIAGRGYMSRYDFALKAADIFGLDRSLIHPISTADLRQPAPRPLRSGLEIDRAEAELFVSFRTPEESLELYKQQEAELPPEPKQDDKPTT